MYAFEKEEEEAKEDFEDRGFEIVDMMVDLSDLLVDNEDRLEEMNEMMEEKNKAEARKSAEEASTFEPQTLNDKDDEDKIDWVDPSTIAPFTHIDTPIS